MKKLITLWIIFIVFVIGGFKFSCHYDNKVKANIPIGTKARLKSGGPVMTIGDSYLGGKRLCTWMSSDGKVQSYYFVLDQLDIVE